MTDPYTPNLSIRVVSEETLRSSKRILSALECPGLHINGHDLTLTRLRHLRIHIAFVYPHPEENMLLLTQARLASRHWPAPLILLYGQRP